LEQSVSRPLTGGVSDVVRALGLLMNTREVPTAVAEQLGLVVFLFFCLGDDAAHRAATAIDEA